LTQLWKRGAFLMLIVLVASMVLAACGSDDDDDPTATSGSGAATATTSGGSEPSATTGGGTEPTATEGSGGEELSGRINIDGSSTVYPVTQAMAEEFQILHGDVQVPVGVSGTGGGFELFCAGEIDISDASRPINEEEVASCEAGGIEFIELPVAYDGLSVVVNPENDWVTCLTVEQLNIIWSPESEGEITSWNQVDPSFPDEPLDLYGPGTDSGTFAYFTDVINGDEGASRGDYTASEDDNVLVQGVSGSVGALGYFGYAYYLANQDVLKLVEIDGGGGCVAPSEETINDGSYTPLSRPLFIYVSLAASERPEVAGFIGYYQGDGLIIIPEIGYVALPEDIMVILRERFASRTTGSVFEGQGASGATVEDLLFPDEQ
jgi:phosphate transport system substrate-binding protein